MKVIHLININTYGGAENLLSTLLPSLRSEGVDPSCIILCPQNKQEAASQIRQHLSDINIPVYFRTYNSLRNLGNFFWIRRVINASGASLVHCHLRYADIWISILKTFRFLNIPSVTTVHGYNDDYMNEHGLEVNKKMRSSAYYRITKWVTAKADGLIFISVCMKDFYSRANFTGKGPNAVIYHGYPATSTTHESPRKNQRSQSPQLVLAGRIVKRKGHLYALAALKILIARFPGAQLHLLGKGPYLEELKAKIAEENLQNAVIFHGYKENIVLEMSNYDIALLPSYWEPFGLVFLDAFASGIPIVAFDLPAGNEIVSHNHSGLLAKPYDAASLASNIQQLFFDNDLTEKLVKNGRIELQTRFSLSRMGSEYATFYKEILQHRNVNIKKT